MTPLHDHPEVDSAACPAAPDAVSRRRRRQVLLSLLVIYSAFIVAVVVFADLRSLPMDWLSACPGADKAGHFLLIGLWALLWNLVLGDRRWRVGPVRLMRGTALLAVAVAAEEASQALLASRSCSWGDLAADVAGIACFSALARVFLRRSANCRAPCVAKLRGGS